MSKRWNKNLVIEEISRLNRERRRINSGFIQIDNPPLYQAGCKHFGSWKASIEASGISYDSVRVLERICPKWGKERILAIIKERHGSGLPLNSNYIQRERAEISMHRQ